MYYCKVRNKDANLVISEFTCSTLVSSLLCNLGHLHHGQLSKNKNLKAVIFGFFSIVTICAMHLSNITFSRSQTPEEQNSLSS